MTAQAENQTTATDRIEKRVQLRAPRARVWRAIADSKEFGKWFGVILDGSFVAGQTTRGRITIKGYEHVTLEMEVQQVEPERYFAYRWHPYAVDAAVDYSSEPTTLVEFHLAEIATGTEVTIVESGFDRIPLDRRSEAFRMNDAGWNGQAKNLERYVS
ncbi:MAG: SRPBCC family protein [Gemmatimonadota bacterium]